MKNILILSNVGMLSAAFRYRIYDTYNILEKNGDVQSDILCLYSDNTMLALSGTNQLLKISRVCLDIFRFIKKLYSKRHIKYDVVVIKTNIFPIMGSFIEKIAASFIKADNWIYDIDDAVYFNMTRKENAIFSKIRDLKSKVCYWVNKTDRVFLSNRVIFGDLKEMFGLNEDKCTFFISSPYKNQYFYDGEDINKEKNNNKIIWLGSPHTQSELFLLKKFIDDIHNWNEKAEIVLMGCEDNFLLFKNIKYVKFVKWTPENEKKEMRSACFGLNPLRNDMFQKRKSAFKVIQYYRAGIIPLVSNVGINKELVEKYGGCVVDSFDNSDYVFEYMRRASNNIQKLRHDMYMKSEDLTVENNAMLIKNTLLL